MIPEHDNYTETPESRDLGVYSFDTWKVLEGQGERITDLEAIAQSIYTILRTRRYGFPIYSGNHGLYIDDLVGESKAYVFTVLKSRIEEALLMDNRITAVDGFYIDKEKSVGHVLVIGYTVHTIVGTLERKGAFNV